MTDPALVDLDGPANFRDLGGFATDDGGRTRPGRLFRSDSLSYLSEADLAHLRAALRVRTVIDLRAGHEVEEFGHGPLSAHVRQLHMPIVDNTRRPAERDAIPTQRSDAFLTLDEIYSHMLDEYGERFGAVLAVIADAETHPLVFHCAAGKDRTGLIAALILALCGVPDSTIGRDFAFTERRMPEIVARHVSRADGAAVEVAGQQYGAQANAMHATLDRVRAVHGSVEHYLAHIGVTDDQVRAIRTAMVEPPA